MTQTDVRIAKATAADVPSLVELSLALFQEDAGQRDPFMNLNWPNEEGDEHYGRLVAGEESLCLLATAGQTPIGYLAGYLWDGGTLRPLKMAELESMYVQQEWRGRGVGRRLVAEFLQWARRKRVQRVSVTAFAANTRAVDFYCELGFEPKSVSLEMGLEPKV